MFSSEDNVLLSEERRDDAVDDDAIEDDKDIYYPDSRHKTVMTPTFDMDICNADQDWFNINVNS